VLIVPTAQAIAVVLATVLGTVIPFLCLKVQLQFRGRTIQIDPALAAGPFITTLNDILSTAIALALSTFIHR
jgi:magnesium transporter